MLRRAGILHGIRSRIVGRDRWFVPGIFFSCCSVRRQRGGGDQSEDKVDDYYQLLGVPTQASHEEIKSAYKKLALELHPDRNKAPDAEERFKRVSEAYSTLGNKQKRQEYDQLRSFQAQQQHQQATPSGGPQGFPGGQFSGNYNTSRVQYHRMTNDEAEKLFREMFGGLNIEQILKDFEARGPTASPRRGSEGPIHDAPFRPFFNQTSRTVINDNGMQFEERTFTDPSGRRYTVSSTTSQNPYFSGNRTAQDHYEERAARSPDGKVHQASHAPMDPRVVFSRDPWSGWSSSPFGSRWGPPPTWSPLIRIAYVFSLLIIISTVLFAMIAFLFSHPFFLLAVVTLYMLRKSPSRYRW